MDDTPEQPRKGAVDPVIEEMAELLSKQKLVPKATTHRLLVSLTPHLVYTTNQDNFFELMAEAYGRQ
jgi:hypothetical protein